MRRVIVTIGAALAAASLAQADGGVALKVDGNRATFRVATMTVRLGEKVALTVFPPRSEGVGEGIVTDFDPHTDRIGLVLTPKIDRSERFFRRPRSQRHGGSVANEMVFRLSEGDVVSIDGLHNLVSNPPEFTVENKEWEPRAAQRDLYLPAVSLAARSVGAGAAAASAPLPNIDALLKGG